MYKDLGGFAWEEEGENRERETKRVFCVFAGMPYSIAPN